jgi:hypothetical protein
MAYKYKVRVVRNRTITESTEVDITSKTKLTEEEVFEQAENATDDLDLEAWEYEDDDCEFTGDNEILEGDVKEE